MRKILLKINSDKDLSYDVDGYVLGIKTYSFSFEKTFDVSEIKKIKYENPNKLIFVSFNKLIFESELKDYKNTLLMIDKVGVDGVIVGDVAALTYELKTSVILDQLHLNNSHYAINHYVNNGVKGVVLTNDITKDEIRMIRKNTDALLFKQAFGYPHLSSSKRRLITNYKTCFSIDDNAKCYKIKDKEHPKYYKIIEDAFGCHIYANNPLNLLGTNLDVDYLILDGYLMGDISDVISAFMSNDTTLKGLIDKKYDCDDGFINKETFYKVK